MCIIRFSGRLGFTTYSAATPGKREHPAFPVAVVLPIYAPIYPAAIVPRPADEYNYDSARLLQPCAAVANFSPITDTRMYARVDVRAPVQMCNNDDDTAISNDDAIINDNNTCRHVRTYPIYILGRSAEQKPETFPAAGVNHTQETYLNAAIIIGTVPAHIVIISTPRSPKSNTHQKRIQRVSTLRVRACIIIY